MKPFKNFDEERAFVQKIGSEAVRKAQMENLKNGIPNVYSKNGTLYFQLPNLEITTENPFENDPV